MLKNKKDDVFVPKNYFFNDEISDRGKIFRSILIIIISVLSVGLIVYAISFFRYSKKISGTSVNYAGALESPSPAPSQSAPNPSPGESGKKAALNNITGPAASPVSEPIISFVGPRKNIPGNSPTDYGFWSFAVPVPGILSRSGQPLISEITWLKNQGWKSIINLRVDGERGEMADDSKLPGFKELGLNYLRLPIADGSPPTNAQAEEFLKFVTDPSNQPAHVHCRGGIGRAGTMVALYRYSVQGWPMEKAIEESRLFQEGISSSQVKWLNIWAGSHRPGNYNA